MASIRTLIAVDEGLEPDAVRAAVPSGDGIEIVGILAGLEDSWSTLQETDTDLLVVACSGYSDRALFLIDAAVKQRSDRPVVVLCEGSPNGFVRRVFEAGADDIVTLPETAANVEFALRKAIARTQRGGAGSGVATSPLICVLGPKGGTGKTVTACNLGVSLAQSGKNAVIVDLDLQFGDVGLSLGLEPERTIADLAKTGGTLDAEKLEAYLVRHASGVRVLMAPTRPDHAGVVTVEFLRELYVVLRTVSDYVIVDTPPSFTPEVITSVDSSTDVCLVGMLDSLSLKNTKLGLETLDLMGYDSSRIRLVLNRAGSKVGISREDVVAVIGRAPDVFVPSDREIPRSVNQGMPIVLEKDRSEAAKAFRSLAELYLVRSEASKNGGSRRLLRRSA